MTKSIDTDAVLKDAEPLVHQHAPEIQEYVHIIRLPRALSAGASFIAADRDHDAERLDAVAGSEFLDDRIRLRE
jgi:hypothetical protein